MRRGWRATQRVNDMANLLYLVHRLPYPPNKGDKVRSYHLLKHLVARHRVFLGTFVDDAEDEPHVDTLRALCAGAHAVRLNPKLARVASLSGLMNGSALTLRYYRDAGLRRWVEDTVRREGIAAAVVFSSSMAQYAEGLGMPMLVDFVDVDSAKWTTYAGHHRWPMSWLYRREGEQLLAYERKVAAGAARSFFVTANEAELFRSLAPECSERVETLSNGVDAEVFQNDPARASPFALDEVPLVFTGAMDYWPNIDAVTWFVREMLPQLQARWPGIRFHIVGREPTQAVRALADSRVNVTGTVPDVRPYLQHAALVVAPLRLARGIQNKVLEAMAMGKVVVTAPGCAAAIGADAQAGLQTADSATDYVLAIDRLLADRAQLAVWGQLGRQHVLRHFSWPAQLAGIDRHLAGLRATPAAMHVG
jgi:polysaccharide biosynthesis protein PslH